eukprot:UN19829
MVILVLIFVFCVEGTHKIFREEECCICLSKKPTFIMRPCGHLCVCKNCIKRRLITCPLCV